MNLSIDLKKIVPIIEFEVADIFLPSFEIYRNIENIPNRIEIMLQTRIRARLFKFGNSTHIIIYLFTFKSTYFQS